MATFSEQEIQQFFNEQGGIGQTLVDFQERFRGYEALLERGRPGGITWSERRNVALRSPNPRTFVYYLQSRRSHGRSCTRYAARLGVSERLAAAAEAAVAKKTKKRVMKSKKVVKKRTEDC